MRYIGWHHGNYHLRQLPNGTIHQHLCLCTILVRRILLFSSLNHPTVVLFSLHWLLCFVLLLLMLMFNGIRNFRSFSAFPSMNIPCWWQNEKEKSNVNISSYYIRFSSVPFSVITIDIAIATVLCLMKSYYIIQLQKKIQGKTNKWRKKWKVLAVVVRVCVYVLEHGKDDSAQLCLHLAHRHTELRLICHWNDEWNLIINKNEVICAELNWLCLDRSSLRQQHLRRANTEKKIEQSRCWKRSTFDGHHSLAVGAYLVWLDAIGYVRLSFAKECSSRSW